MVEEAAENGRPSSALGRSEGHSTPEGNGVLAAVHAQAARGCMPLAGPGRAYCTVIPMNLLAQPRGVESGWFKQ
jgi:hypothetical protein